MAEVGPCGPDSEIHFDRGVAYCDKQEVPGHLCRVNGDCHTNGLRRVENRCPGTAARVRNRDGLV